MVIFHDGMLQSGSTNDSHNATITANHDAQPPLVADGKINVIIGEGMLI